jgi:hypothetical protein
MENQPSTDNGELTENLYSPLNFYMRYDESLHYSDYDEIYYWRDEITHAEAFDYMDNMKELLARELKDTSERGMMDYCDVGRLPEKVQSLQPNVEVQGDKIWFVANIKLNEPLTYSDMRQLKEWWLGQLSDGLGESLEQREMRVGCGEFYMEPWTESKYFFIDTQEEFNERMGLDQSKDMDTVNTRPDTKLSISEESEVLKGISAESERSTPLPEAIIDENSCQAVQTTMSDESDRPAVQTTISVESDLPAVQAAVSVESDRPAFQTTVSVDSDRSAVQTAMSAESAHPPTTSPTNLDALSTTSNQPAFHEENPGGSNSHGVQKVAFDKSDRPSVLKQLQKANIPEPSLSPHHSKTELER